MDRFSGKVRQNIKKIKVNALDEAETDFIDLDTVLNYYIDEFRLLKKKKMQTISKVIEKQIRANEHEEIELNMK